MSSKTAAPSSLSGIKRLAKALRREHNVPHHAALDLAACKAGYQNIRDAQNQLKGPVPQRHLCFLTAYWSKRGARGRETLAIYLPSPLSRIVASHQLSSARNLQSFRLESVDHLERKVDLDSQELAHEVLFAAVRTLRFMAATGLRPITTLKHTNFIASEFLNLPGRDHPSGWLDEQGEWVFLDEPYSSSSLVKREAWAKERGLIMITTSWQGLLAPGASIPFLFCEQPSLAERLQGQLGQLQMTLSEPLWDGESGPYKSLFISPAREASGKSRRPRQMPAYPGYAVGGALPYGARTGGQSSSWRPEIKMPLSLHLTVGPLLSALAVSSLPLRLRNAVIFLRTTLDDWLQMEYPTEQEMSSDQFREAYYGVYRFPITELNEQVRAVQIIAKEISRGYADCRPRKKLLKMLTEMESTLSSKANHT